MSSYPEYKIVQQCLRLIETQLDWGNSNSWHNDVFLELSEKIQQKTHVLLSPTTLKRVWGRVNYKSAPSISTLNTLSQFAGFNNWRDYKNQTVAKKTSWIEKNITHNLGVIMVSAAIMTIVFISFYSLIGAKSELTDFDISQIKFESNSVTKGLPNTVVFDFDLKEIQSDSIHIQQFWDPSKTINIIKGQKQATGQYYYPGYFRAKLVVEGKIIKEHDLFIESNGWLGTINYEPIPKYIQESNILNNGLSFNELILDEIKSSKEPIITAFQRVEKFDEISGDNFELHTSIKNVYNDKWAVCQIAKIYILGSKSAIIVPFSIKGCVSELGVMMSDNFISGKEHDLSSLGVDLSTFRDVKIKVADKNITVFIEDVATFSSNYTKTIGEIVGMRFQFLGAGEVKYVSIKDLSESTIILEEDFAMLE